MNDCLFCGKEVVTKPGKKPRQFCGGNCRNKHYYKVANEGKIRKKPGRKPKGVPLPQDYVEIKGTIKAVDSTGKTVIEDVAKPITRSPKNLDELKSLCPENLSGFDRSMWIAENRQKYGL